MIEEIKALQKEIAERMQLISGPEQLEEFRLEYLVKKGRVQALFDRMKEVPREEKPLIGKELNILRNTAEGAYKKLKEKFEEEIESTPDLDLTLPGRRGRKGTYQVMDRMTEIFVNMGFDIAEGPEIEDEYHNFDGPNFPKNHPARDMQDTFFIKSGRTDNELVLRTHTTPMQIRVMNEQKPPIRCIMPVRVYRNEAINARSLAEFHQIEGLYIDKDVSLAELKGTIIAFARKMYGENSEFRFRPSYFPFTEPSAEVDITCFLCKGEGCRICKHTGWLEIAGCGMVHHNVLKAGNIDTDEYTGYAFGFGIERVALLWTGIDDIRLFYENDIRVLNQF
ncbi:MAG: phenylalanine--tRNA ligase subunit alpha [Bacteroidota bacterium]